MEEKDVGGDGDGDNNREVLKSLCVFKMVCQQKGF